MDQILGHFTLVALGREACPPLEPCGMNFRAGRKWLRVWNTLTSAVRRTTLECVAFDETDDKGKDAYCIKAKGKLAWQYLYDNGYYY